MVGGGAHLPDLTGRIPRLLWLPLYGQYELIAAEYSALFADEFATRPFDHLRHHSHAGGRVPRLFDRGLSALGRTLLRSPMCTAR